MICPEELELSGWGYPGVCEIPLELLDRIIKNMVYINNWRRKMERKIGIIGYGSMGKMICSKFIESKIIKEADLFIANRTYEKIMHLNTSYPQINVCKNNTGAAKNADMIFICVKPLKIKNVLLEIIKDIKNSCHIISLNGSVLFKQLEQICINRKISKVIPSVTAEINQSVTLMCHNDYVKNEDKNNLKELLECFGTALEIPEKKWVWVLN